MNKCMTTRLFSLLLLLWTALASGRCAGFLTGKEPVWNWLAYGRPGNDVCGIGSFFPDQAGEGLALC